MDLMAEFHVLIHIAPQTITTPRVGIPVKCVKLTIDNVEGGLGGGVACLLEVQEPQLASKLDDFSLLTSCFNINREEPHLFSTDTVLGN